jgi:hypothetical protein
MFVSMNTPPTRPKPTKTQQSKTTKTTQEHPKANGFDMPAPRSVKKPKKTPTGNNTQGKGEDQGKSPQLNLVAYHAFRKHCRTLGIADNQNKDELKETVHRLWGSFKKRHGCQVVLPECLVL